MASTNISLTIDYVKFVKFTLEGVAYTPVAILGFFGIFSGLIKYHFILRDIRSGGRLNHNCHNTRLCFLGHFSKYIILILAKHADRANTRDKQQIFIYHPRRQV